MGHLSPTPYARQADLKMIIQARLGARFALWLAVVCVLAMPLWRATQGRLDLARLGAQDREALVARTIESMRSLCSSQADPALIARCHQQAELLLQLDGCDAGCRALATRYAARPTR